LRRAKFGRNTFGSGPYFPNTKPGLYEAQIIFWATLYIWFRSIFPQYKARFLWSTNHFLGHSVYLVLVHISPIQSQVSMKHKSNIIVFLMSC